MPIINSKTGQVAKEYSVEDLKKAARQMRGYNLISLACAGSGHAGGTLSIMDIAAALYLKVARHDPKDSQWPDRDRIIWSTGHKAPALYISLGMSGYFPIEEVAKLRRLYSPYQGHPHWLKLDGIEASTGSLGQGLSISNGIALAGRLDKKDYRVFCLMGDGEQQEGQIWEAAMEAGHYKLDNLVGILDKNRLQIDGWVKDVMDIDPVIEKYKAFNWNVIEIDGHDMADILRGFDEAAAFKGKPTLLVAHTVKGKGVSFMENIAGWHGKSPSVEEMEKGLRELGIYDEMPVKRMFQIAADYQKDATKKLEAKMPKFSRDYFWNQGTRMKVDMSPTRKGFGKALCDTGVDERVVCLGADISDSITISDFYKGCPGRETRFLSMGIAEQSATGVAAGLAKEGKLPVFGTYGVFASGRNLDQLRTTVCYGEFSVFVAGAHGGVSVGPDGATHQALEELFQMCGLPNMTVVVPCDYVETKRASEYALFSIPGPKYLRFAREATPIVTSFTTPWKFGEANIIRYRGEKDKFIDAFEHVLASKYTNEHEDLTIIACGPSVPEAMRAAYILKEEFGLETRIVNMHTVKPLDTRTIIRAALETPVIVTAEEHQVGGFGNWIAATTAQAKELFGKPVVLGMIGVLDRFGESGAPWELVKEFEVSAEHIASKAKELSDFAKRESVMAKARRPIAAAKAVRPAMAAKPAKTRAARTTARAARPRPAPRKKVAKKSGARGRITKPSRKKAGRKKAGRSRR
jgi:transketolase